MLASCPCLYSGWGQGDGESGEKEAGGVGEAGKQGARSGIIKVAGSGRKRGKSKNAKRWEPINTGREPGLKGMGSGRLIPPPPSRLPHSVGLVYFSNK